MTGFVDLEELLEHTMAGVREEPITVEAEYGDVEFRWNQDVFEIVYHPWSPNDDSPDFIVLSAKYRVEVGDHEITVVEIVDATHILSLPMEDAFWAAVEAKCHALITPEEC